MNINHFKSILNYWVIVRRSYMLRWLCIVEIPQIHCWEVWYDSTVCSIPTSNWMSVYVIVYYRLERQCLLVIIHYEWQDILTPLWKDRSSLMILSYSLIPNKYQCLFSSANRSTDKVKLVRFGWVYILCFFFELAFCSLITPSTVQTSWETHMKIYTCTWSADALADSLVKSL